MICSVIQNKNLTEILSILEEGNIEMAEIRLDSCTLEDDDIDLLFSSSTVPLLATCRIGSQGAQWSEHRLSIAIEAGAAFADLEIEAPTQMGKRLRRLCTDRGTMFIRSFHDFNGTPVFATLVEMINKCHRYGADIAKIVTTARCEDDVKTVMSLYGHEKEGSLIAFCMGDQGSESRITALAKAAPFSYAALTDSDSAAPGQIPTAQMLARVYGEAEPYDVRTEAPCSKSFSQRAIIMAAIAEGESHLYGYTPCADSEAALHIARSLGAEVSLEGDTLSIRGTGCAHIESDSFHMNESGLLTRLLIPLLSVLGGGQVHVTGEGTLLGRPLTGAAGIMASYGLRLANESEHEGKEVFVPLKVSGNLIPGKAEVSGKGSSQLISGLLMSLPLCDKDSELFVTEPKSIPYIFITVDILKKFGITMECEMEGDEDFMQTQNWAYCTGIRFRIPGGQHYKASDFKLEGDWSSAAPFLVAGAIAGHAAVEGLDTTSIQADLTIMDILVEAGASISQIETDIVSVEVSKSPLFAFDFDLNNAPDLFPVVAVLAAFCTGESHIAGVGRLAVKESDRAKAILGMLSQMGVNASVDGDVMSIEGHSLAWRALNGKLLKSGSYTSYHDHRMVMALSVASLGADGPVLIDDTACVSKSFPSFLEKFGKR